MTLGEYVEKFTERGECQCRKCVDKGGKTRLAGHTADLMFFEVAMKEGATAEEFTRLTKEHEGKYGPCDPFDGKEHGYLELGGWIGDQALALRFMGLGHLLRVFDLLTPRTMLSKEFADEMGMEMAGKGMVTVQLMKEKPCPK